MQYWKQFSNERLPSVVKLAKVGGVVNEEQRLKQQEEASRASRQKRCAWCAHYPGCSLSNGEGAYNCTGFRPR